MFTGLVREVGTVRSMDGGRLVVETSIDRRARRLDRGRRRLPDRRGERRRHARVRRRAGDALAHEPRRARARRGRQPRAGAARRRRARRPLRAGPRRRRRHLPRRSPTDCTGSTRRRRSSATSSRRARSPSRGRASPSRRATTRGFAVALIPHTLEATTLGRLEPGARVNLEADVLAKYVEKLISR